ncbi:acyltransferase [Sphaerisporangium sp. B11E5]|uniref:acyltransferase family protein n=1 Tax=Sphaerisporangium sp. B11E5 TaxID=3153563 RepID=UPI00325D4B45
MGITPPETTERRPELDAIRTLVVLGLVFFHSALVFDTRDDFYVKNAETTDLTTSVAAITAVWAMPALFLIAGLGSWHSLRRSGPGGFAVKRLLRLGLPLLVGTVTIVPIPQWLRLRADPAYHESYLAFLPRFFDVRLDLPDFPFVLSGEHFETGHLWFLVLLLAFSLMLAPGARLFPRERAGRVREALARVAERRGGALLPAVPVAAVSAAAGLEEGFAAWHRWAYLLFFLYGFVLASDERFRVAMRRDAVAAGVLALVLFPVGMVAFLTAAGVPGADPFTDPDPLATAARALYGATGWFLVVAVIGLLDRRRRAPREDVPDGAGRKVYAYLAVAALPLYVLHQPIVVAVAYGVVRWSAPIAVKYAVIVTVSLALTVAAYELLVRRTRATRALFGVPGSRARS